MLEPPCASASCSFMGYSKLQAVLLGEQSLLSVEQGPGQGPALPHADCVALGKLL